MTPDEKESLGDAIDRATRAVDARPVWKRGILERSAMPSFPDGNNPEPCPEAEEAASDFFCRGCSHSLRQAFVGGFKAGRANSEANRDERDALRSACQEALSAIIAWERTGFLSGDIADHLSSALDIGESGGTKEKA